MTVPQITLNDQTTIPQLGLGVWQVPPDDTERVVGEALEVGYRHIDTAQMYGNEGGVGAAIKASGLAREDVYVTTKLNNDNHERPRVAASLQRSLELLQLDRVDLFLIHWPMPTEYDGDYTGTWEALLEMREQGLATSVGVSNFQPAHLHRIATETGVTPAVNQIEIHPYFTNDSARAASLALGAKVEAWSPLGQGGGELEDAVVTGIAQEHGKTPAQVLLRWQLDRGDIVFPKSLRRERMQENFDLFDFALTPDQVDALSALDKGEAGRTGPNPDEFAWIPA
jgi:diketogulonate reductase-like aldo/keto reductase